MRTHERAVAAVADRLRSLGMSTLKMPRHGCPFDLLANDHVRIEIKSTEVDGKWLFNIARNGKLHLGSVDFYVLNIPPVKELGFNKPIRIVVPASRIEPKSSVCISVHNLTSRWAKYINCWEPVVEKGRRPRSRTRPSGFPMNDGEGNLSPETKMDNKQKETLATRLLELRHSRKWTQARLSRAIGISRISLSKAESGYFSGERSRSLYLIRKFLEASN